MVVPLLIRWYRVTVGSLLMGAILAIVGFGAFNPPPVQAATSNTLNFQARLLTASGALVPDGFYNIEFKLYSASQADGGETPIQGSCTTNPGGVADEDCAWTEAYYDTNGATAGNDFRIRVVNGYMTVNLGSITSFPGTINWDQDLYLTMNIGGSNQTATPTYDGEMTPRLKLTGVPYAFRAAQLAKYNVSTGFTSLLELLQPTVGNQTFQIADQGAAGTYTLCMQNSPACGFALSAGGNYLAKNANDTSTASYLGTLLGFSNTNNGAAGVLSLTNSGTNAALTVTQSGNPSAGQALIVANNTNGTPAGNLMDLQVGGVSRVLVDYLGNITAVGAYNTNTFTGSDLTFGTNAAATIHGAIQATANAAGNSLTIHGGVANGSSTGNTGGSLLLLGGAAAGTGANNGGTATLRGGLASGAGNGGTTTVSGGFASTTAGSAGGAVSIVGANGTATGTGGVGGSITVTGGNAQGSGNNNGGNVSIQGGTQTGTGNAGSVRLQTSGGNVGIGNATPGYVLDVTGDINTSTQYRIGGTVVCTITGCAASGGSGNYIQNSTSPQTANFYITSANAGDVTATVRGASGQTANLLELIDGGGIVVASFTPSGSFVSAGDITFTKDLSHTISVADPTVIDTVGESLTLQAATGNGNAGGGGVNINGGDSGATGGVAGAVTLSGGDGFGLSAGGDINILGGGGTAGGVVSLQAGPGLVEYESTDINVLGGRVNIGTALNNAKLSIVNQEHTGDIGLLVRGMASQTGDLLQAQNSSGATLFRVSASGVIGSADTASASTNSFSIVIRSGNATGTTSNSGSVSIDVGTATGSAGTISVGTANTSGIVIGRSGINTNVASDLQVNGTTVITTGQVLQNVTTNTSILTAGILGIARGGTGNATYSSSGVVYYNGTNFVSTAAGSNGNCLLTTGGVPAWGSCGSGTPTLQQVYTASSNPEIVVDATRGALTVRDASSALGANLLEVQNNAGTTTYFAVTSAGTEVKGEASSSAAVGPLVVSYSGTDDVGVGLTADATAVTGGGGKSYTFLSTGAGLGPGAGSLVFYNNTDNNYNMALTPVGHLQLAQNQLSGQNAQLFIQPNAGTNNALLLRAHASQSVAVLRIEDSSNVAVLTVNDVGRVIVQNSTNNTDAVGIYDVAGQSILNVDTINKSVGTRSTTNGTATSAFILQSGSVAGGSGGSGNVSIDVGATSGTPGSINMGANNTRTINIGASPATTAMSVTIKGGTSSVSGGVNVTLGATASTNAVCSSLANATGPTAGTAYELRDCNAAPAADFAEMYPGAQDLDVGDVITLGNHMVDTFNWDATTSEVDWNSPRGKVPQMIKETVPYSASTFGIVSDNYLDFVSTGHNIKESDNPTSVALVGRVLVKISTENGDIRVGDFLTASATKPGYAMKATHAGYVIGQALEAFGGSATGKVMVFARTSYYPGPTIQDILGTDVNLSSVITNTLGVNGAASIQNLNVGGSATIRRLTVTSSVTIGQNLTVVDTVTTKDIKVTGSADIVGDLNLTGQVNTRNAITKRFKASGRIEAGSIVVLDQNYDGHVMTTTIAEDTRIIGVAVTSASNRDEEIRVAIGGQVEVMLSALPVLPGDLLVSDTVTGTAKAQINPSVGTVLGKATSKKGSNSRAWVLLTLQ